MANVTARKPSISVEQWRNSSDNIDGQKARRIRHSVKPVKLREAIWHRPSFRLEYLLSTTHSFCLLAITFTWKRVSHAMGDLEDLTTPTEYSKRQIALHGITCSWFFPHSFWVFHVRGMLCAIWPFLHCNYTHDFQWDGRGEAQPSENVLVNAIRETIIGTTIFNHACIHVTSISGLTLFLW